MHVNILYPRFLNCSTQHSTLYLLFHLGISPALSYPHTCQVLHSTVFPFAASSPVVVAAEQVFKPYFSLFNSSVLPCSGASWYKLCASDRPAHFKCSANQNLMYLHVHQLTVAIQTHGVLLTETPPSASDMV